MLTQEELHEIARGAIERNLGDVVTEEDHELSQESLADRIYDEAFVLAHDALLDRGIEPEMASYIAQQEAQKVAQP